MLSSSDAKWRCLWQMFVWSILMTLVSQLLNFVDHIAFYIFAALCVLILPVLTAVYSNTSGRKCSGLLRAGYVVTDPVAACLTVTPLLLIHDLPQIVDEYYCFGHHEDWNLTIKCLENTTMSEPINIHAGHQVHEDMLYHKKIRFVVLQCSLALPVILSLLMGRRTRKMALNTYLLAFAYWFVVALEAASLLETTFIHKSYKHVIYTTETIISIVIVITNSYAVATLLSYISPMGTSDDKEHERKFDFLFKVFMGLAGVFFAEIPIIVARVQMMAMDSYAMLPGSFYLWFTKNIFFVILTFVMIGTHQFRKTYPEIRCKPSFDTYGHKFQPEKRDVYIQRRRVTYNQTQNEPGRIEKTDEQKKKQKRVTFKMDMGKGRFKIVKAENDNDSVKDKIEIIDRKPFRKKDMLFNWSGGESAPVRETLASQEDTADRAKSTITAGNRRETVLHIQETDSDREAAEEV